MTRSQLAAAVRDVLGTGVELRDAQAQALDAVRRQDTLLVARSGAGKTAVYDIAARLVDGLTLVVSPTLSLQRDQAESLRAGGSRAVVLNSTRSARAEREALDGVRQKAVDLLLLAPEQLAREPVAAALEAADVGLLVVDEAHCVSEWGHDFRPDYLQIAAAAGRLGGPRLLALTATASRQVREDVVERLGMRDAAVVVGDVDRPNIWLGARDAADPAARDAAVVEAATSLDGAGIVYAQTRSAVEHLVALLTEAGRPASGYHAGMAARERDRTQDAFSGGSLDLVVATSAFGMGIDRADVRFVVHAGPPPSLDAYYQEVGRAGRDGAAATALLVHRGEDFALGAYLRGGGGPRPATLRAVAGPLHAGERLTRPELAERSGLSPRTVSRAVGALLQAGAVTEDEEARLAWGAGGTGVPEVLARVAGERDRRRRTDRSRVEMVRTFADTLDCRRRMLLELLGEEHPHPCGRCDNCDAGSSEDAAGGPFRLGQHVRHREFGEGAVSLLEADRVTVMFTEHGYKTMALELLAGDEGLLTPADR